MTAGRDLGGLMLPSSVKLFRLDRLGWISSETIEWVRARLNLAE
jgi:predicted DNA-binding transcriptional regulator AlpA